MKSFTMETTTTAAAPTTPHQSVPSIDPEKDHYVSSSSSGHSLSAMPTTQLEDAFAAGPPEPTTPTATVAAEEDQQGVGRKHTLLIVGSLCV
jgi:hypothetical protein